MAKKESKQKKMNVRVDFTPMVDMLMLLITFFMLCTSLSKPQTMELTMPSNDENTQEDQKNEAKASETVTLYITADTKIYYGAGIPKYDDPTWIKETTWGSQGIRKVLREHATENGTRPVERIALAVKELNMDRLFVIALLGLFSGNCLAIEATGEIRTNILTEISVSASVIEGETAKTLYKFLSPAAQEIEPGVWFNKGTNISCLEIKNQIAFYFLIEMV